MAAAAAAAAAVEETGGGAVIHHLVLSDINQMYFYDRIIVPLRLPYPMVILM
jgi:hypothetical protein